VVVVDISSVPFVVLEFVVGGGLSVSSVKDKELKDDVICSVD